MEKIEESRQYGLNRWNANEENGNRRYGLIGPILTLYTRNSDLLTHVTKTHVVSSGETVKHCRHLKSSGESSGMTPVSHESIVVQDETPSPTRCM
jgi:hypothetical protein